MSNSPHQKCPECGGPMVAIVQLRFALDPADPEDTTLWICGSPACRRRRDDADGDLLPGVEPR